jgi:hypothetical protein
MTKKQRQAYAAVAVIVLIVLAIWFFKTKNTGHQIPDQNGQANSQSAQNQQMAAVQTTGTWSGVLKNSDSAAKGNLMLVTSSRNIYFHSSRDYSSLIGKKVIASYKGTLQSFTLQSITAQ